MEAVIGLEIHAQLLTQSKMFCGDAAHCGAEPNTQISAISLAHPGTLPRVNKKAVEFAIRMGLACGSKISAHQVFDRKNYFYPDLPKGYQLTQDRTPVCVGGTIVVSIDGQDREIALNRIHLEEDAGKSLHDHEADTLIDFNRAGVPLIEIVTEPVLRSAAEAGALMSEVRKLVRYLGICDGNMEEGSLRCDANVSVRPTGSATLGKKVEVKNMNSVRHLQRAIEFEIERQKGIVAGGGTVVSETRTFAASSGKTCGMRTKEELSDYRYFPDPDVAPLVISSEWIEDIKSQLPALPRQRHQHYVSVFGLPHYDATVITDSRELADYFEQVCTFTTHYKAASNWIMGPVKSYLNEHQTAADGFPLTAKILAEIIDLVASGKVSFAMASQKLLPALMDKPAASVVLLAEELNLLQTSDAGDIAKLVAEVVREFPLKVEAYKKGKKAIVTMFMGEVMKRSQGKADPRLTQQLVIQALNDPKN